MRGIDVASIATIPLALLLLPLVSGSDASGEGTVNLNNGTNTTECDQYEGTSTVYNITAPIWIVMFVFWWWMVFCYRFSVANDMHRMLIWVPLLETLHGLLSMGYYSMCPWDADVSSMIATTWVVVSILREPVILFCLLMVAKGWCVTREALGPQEMMIACINASLVYIAIISMYAVSLIGFTSLLAAVPLLAVYVAMLVNIMISIGINLRYLKAQLIALRHFNINATTTPVYAKYTMFIALFWCSLIYLSIDLTIIVLDYTTDVAHRWTRLLRQTIEIFAAVAIGYKFRPRALNPMFEQVQRIASDLAEAVLPEITTITIDANMLSGEGTVTWSDQLELSDSQGGASELPEFFVVLNPGDMAPAASREGRSSLVMASRLKSVEPPHFGVNRLQESGRAVVRASNRDLRSGQLVAGGISRDRADTRGRGPRAAQVAPSPSPPWSAPDSSCESTPNTAEDGSFPRQWDGSSRNQLPTPRPQQSASERSTSSRDAENVHHALVIEDLSSNAEEADEAS